MKKTVPPIDAEALLQHSDFMRALAKSLLLDDARADDVVQEAWVAALQKPPRDVTRLRAWLATVVRNFAVRSHREKRRRNRRERTRARPGEVPSSAEILERENTRRRVVMAVLDLEEPYRSAIVLRYLEELPPREVARRLDVPVETVRTRVKRALAQLRGRLDDEHGGDRRAWSLSLIPFAVPKSAATAAVAAIGVTSMSMKTTVALVALVCAVVLVAWRLGRDDSGSRERNETRAESRNVPAVAPDDEERETSDRDAGAAVTLPPEPPPTPPPGTTIAGRVLADGQPLSGAYVYLERGDDLVERLHATDATGRFHFTQAGELVVGAAHPRRRPLRKRITARRGEITEVTLDLGKSEEVTLRVIDGTTGAPLPGAEVMVLRSGESGDSHNAAIEQMLEAEGGFSSLLRRYSVFDDLGDMFALFEGETRLHIPPLKTDYTGRVTVSGLIDPRLVAVVDHPGYPARLVDADGKDGEIEVTLVRGASLTVIAPRFDGKIAADYVCEVDRVALLPLPAGEARFDRDGRAVIASFRPGRYLVVISPEGTWQLAVTTKEEVDDEGNKTISRSAKMGRSVGRALIRREVTLEAGRDTLLDLRRVGGARITGRVVPFEPEPPGWLVILRGGPDLAEEVATTEVGKEGTFNFDRVAPGRYRVVAFEVRGGGVRLEKEIEVRPADTEIPLTLIVPQGEVTGLVTGADGEPLGGATVFALPKDRAGPEANRELRRFGDVVVLITARAETATDGTYRLRNVPSTDHYVYCAKDGWLAREEFKLDEGEKRRLDLHMGRSWRVTLTLEANGKPQPGFLMVRGALGGYLVAMALGADDLSPDTAARDTFTFHLPRGRYHVDVFSEGFAPRRGHPLDVNGDETVALRLDRGVAVRLELATAAGPLGNAEVEIRDAAGLTLPKDVRPLELIVAAAPWRTDDGGAVTLPHVAPGRYTVHVGDKKVGHFDVHGRPTTRRIRLPRE